MTSSPSVHRNMDGPSKRVVSGHSSRTRVEMHQVDVQLQKEIDRLERQQSAAVTNIANHQQAMKMTWRKLEQRRASSSPLVSRQKEPVVSSPSSRRGLHSSTKPFVSTSDVAPPTQTVVSSQVVTVTGDLHHVRQMGSHGPPLISDNHKHFSSSYLSSPYSVRRIDPVKKMENLMDSTRSDSAMSKITRLSVNDPDQRHPSFSHFERALSGRNDLDTTDKDALLKASILMGVKSSSHGPQSFKNFYSTGIDHSQSAASFLVSTKNTEEPNVSKCTQLEKASRNTETISSSQHQESDLGKMLEDIKNCRYIRRYHPDGTALEEYY